MSLRFRLHRPVEDFVVRAHSAQYICVKRWWLCLEGFLERCLPVNRSRVIALEMERTGKSIGTYIVRRKGGIARYNRAKVDHVAKAAFVFVL